MRLLSNAKALTQGVGSIQLRHIEAALLARNGNSKDLALLDAVAFALVLAVVSGGRRAAAAG